MGGRTLIIAEAGVNHNGSLERAKEMIRVASEAGADAVKFQTFKAERMISRHAPKAEYQKRATGVSGSQLDMIRDLELGEKAHLELMETCMRSGVKFLSSPFDIDSAEYLWSLGLEIMKIPSGEITNLPLLRRLGRHGKKLILSTGMADLGEIEDALNALVSAGASLGDITLLQCTTEYPACVEDVNLRAMDTMRHAFPGVSVGYSDHTEGIEVSIAAVAMGALVIEKHFTLDRDLPGPDHRSSLLPTELSSLVRSIRKIEVALGDGCKRPCIEEKKNRVAARKSIVAAKRIRKGETLTEENLTVKRPGGGISPMRWDEVIGNPAVKDYEPDELL